MSNWFPFSHAKQEELLLTEYNMTYYAHHTHPNITCTKGMEFWLDSLNEEFIRTFITWCRNIVTNKILAILMDYCFDGKVLHIGALVSTWNMPLCIVQCTIKFLLFSVQKRRVEACIGFGYVLHTEVNPIWSMWIINTTQFIWEASLCRSKLHLPFQMRHSVMELGVCLSIAFAMEIGSWWRCMARHNISIWSGPLFCDLLESKKLEYRDISVITCAKSSIITSNKSLFFSLDTTCHEWWIVSDKLQLGVVTCSSNNIL